MKRSGLTSSDDWKAKGLLEFEDLRMDLHIVNEVVLLAMSVGVGELLAIAKETKVELFEKESFLESEVK